MKNLRSWIKTSAVVACGAIMLSLPGGVALADKKPPTTPVLWPGGAKVVADVSFSYGFRVYVLQASWPTATGADHYRVTWVRVEKPQNVVVGSESPINTTSFATGLDSGTYRIAVTAYSGPDEATAYSETIQTSVRVPPLPRLW